jgi:DNA modification methylase
MNKIEFGNNIDTLKKWADDGVQVQTCITSPPYFGLRSYLNDDDPEKVNEIGLEQTPEEYIQNLVEVFRAVWDVLADDGTLWVNISDSYSGSGGQGTKPNIMSKEAAEKRGGRPIRVPGLKNKDLIGIPWMLAMALRNDGWYLRSDIIWSKNSCMPESVKDRCTRSHEYVFMFSKQPTYYYDYKAIKEPNADPSRTNYQSGARSNGLNKDRNDNDMSERMKEYVPDGRNKRSVWTVNPKPYKGSHFAVWPVELIEPMILAGSKIGDTVLDPFMGSGTSAYAALIHGRKYLGCELNKEYEPLQQQRIAEAIIGKPDSDVIDDLFEGL